MRYISIIISLLTALSLYASTVDSINSGMMADWLQCHFPDINIRRINKVQGQPFLVGELVEGVKNIVNE